MTLDHSRGCVNFRDVGDVLCELNDGPVIPTGRLLRGGKLTFVEDWDTIEKAETIINLRGGRDPERFPATYLHFPRTGALETYDTTDKAVRRWLGQVLTAIAEAALPVMLHCTSGKDRTGIAVAAVLTVLGVDRALIEEEYLLSDGEVRRRWIQTSLDGFGDPDRYFRRVPLDVLRRRLLSPSA